MRSLVLLAPLALVIAPACFAPTNPFDPNTPADLQAPSKIVGSVKGPEGSLAGATVTAGATSLVTEDDGAFSIEVVPGVVTVSVTHPAHLPFFTGVTAIAGATSTLDVIMEPLPQAPGDDVAHVFGVAHKSGQLALPEAEQDHSGIVVEVLGAGVRAVTNLAGEFDLFLNPGTYDLSLATAGHVEIVVQDVVADAGADTEVPGSPFALQGVPGTVSGIALLEDGAAPDGIDIDLAGGGTAVTDATGAFTVGDVPAGSYLLTATKDGYEPFFGLGFIQVEAGRETVLPSFTLELSRGAVVGRVELAGQADHSGAVVQLAGGAGTAVTGTDGTFRIENVREGSYTLSASKDGFSTAEVAGVVVVANGEVDVGVVTLAVLQGDFAINNGAQFTNDPLVTLDIESDGAIEMRISEDAGFTGVAFETFNAAPTFTLSSGDGRKTVFVEVRDADGVSQVLSASITLDETAPVLDTLAINGGATFTNSATGIVTLSLSASDATSGVNAMQISNDATFNEPFEPFVTSKVHTLDAPGTDGPKTVHVQVRDVAGNVSDPVTASIELDRAPPALTLLRIDCDGNTGPTFCRSPFVTVHVTSTDAVAMSISNQQGSPNAIFVPFTVDTAHVLLPGDGLRDVFVQLRDAAGNVSSEFSTSVTVDTTPPTLASVIVAGGAAAVRNESVTATLSAQGATKMRVAFDGVLDNEPVVNFATSLAGTLPTGDGTKTVVAVFLDDAGNVSTVASDTVELDKTPPSAPSISIEGGASFTRSVSVTLALSAVGATEMRTRTDNAFDAEVFVPLAQTAVTLLPSGDCGSANCKQVCAEFRDAAGNTSQTVCDTITLDSTAPAIPVITTPSGVVSATAFTLALSGQPADTFFGGYEVVVDPGDNGAFRTIAPLAGNPPRFALTLSAPSATDPALAATTNLIRIRAFDQAGNRSVEATLSVVVDPIAPATPVPTATSAVVNADTFAVFFDPTNTSADDATFDHYEIAVVSPARPTPTFTRTELVDGLIFTLEQGNDTTCASPCANQLQVRAVDAAGNTSGTVQVAVAEDSTFPTQPRFTPRGARITALDARMRLEERSQDNGADAVLYEVVGGDIPSFREVSGTQIVFPFFLDRRDFTHELCVRAKDLAGNVSTADCVAIEQRSSLVIAAEGVDEDRPSIFGDLIAWEDDRDGVRVADIRTGVEQLLDATGRDPRVDGDANTIHVVWPSQPPLTSAETRLATYNVDGLGGDVLAISADQPATFQTCAPNLVGVESVDVGGDDIVIVGNDLVGTGVFATTVSGCGNNATRITSNLRNVSLCRGRSNTHVRVHGGVATWCETNGSNAQEVHRVILANGGDEIIATNVDNGFENAHQPVVTSDGLYWGSGNDLCRIDATAAVGSAFVGCPAGQRVLAGTAGLLTGGDEDRIGMVIGGNFLVEPKDAAVFDRSSGTILEVTNDILDQEAVEVWRDRVAYADRQRFSNDIVVREQTEGTWVVADDAIEAGPRVVDDRFIVWVGAGDSGIQISALDLTTNTELVASRPGEQLALGDSLITAANGKVAYGVIRNGTSVDLFVQDILTGNRTLIESASTIEAPELTEDGTRLAWFNGDRGGLKTVTLNGITPGVVQNVGATTGRVGRLGVAGNTIVFENQVAEGDRRMSCTQVGRTSNTDIDLDGRGASIADVAGIGLVAAWGGNNTINTCVLDCDNTPSCPIQTLASSGGGQVELPKVSSSGYVTWTSNQTGDSFGQIAVYDLTRDVRWRVASDFGVDGDAPVFDAHVRGDLLVWSGFAFGTSDIFMAVLAD